MRIPPNPVLLLAGILMQIPGPGAAAPVRQHEVEAAFPVRQAELDQRAAATRVWDSTAEMLAEIEGAIQAEPPVTPMAGFQGPREGDMDQVLRAFPSEPGVARWFFGYGGRGTEARAFVVSQTSNGRLLMVGQVGTPDSGGLPTRIGIAQFAQAGGLDTSFNGTGLQTFDFGNPRLELVAGFGLTETLHGVFYDRVYLLARDFELASGETFALICLRRFTPASPFETCPDISIRYYALARAADCPTDDSIAAGMHLHRANPPRIFMVGSTRRVFNDCADFDWAVIKVGLDGELDTGFGGTGQVSYWVPNSQPADVARARAVAVRVLGNFVLVGGSTGTGAEERSVIAQFTPAGTIDAAFCASDDADCPSPGNHRNGRRSWNSNDQGAVTALAPTLGEGIYTVRRVGTDASVQTYAAISRVDEFGRCQVFFCNEPLLVPSDRRYEPVAAVWRTRPGGFDVTVAGWGSYLSDPDRNQAYVYRFLNGPSNSLDIDADFVTRDVVTWRQDIDWPTGGGGSAPREARVFGMSMDRQGRVMIAGTSRVIPGEFDMSIARLQGRLELFSNGFE